MKTFVMNVKKLPKLKHRNVHWINNYAIAMLRSTKLKLMLELKANVLLLNTKDEYESNLFGISFVQHSISI